MYYVYILISRRNSSKVYIGRAKDLVKRIRQHNSKQGAYSKRWAPWGLETYIVFRNRELAGSFEKYLKHGSGHAFLKKRFLPEINEAAKLL